MMMQERGVISRIFSAAPKKKSGWWAAMFFALAAFPFMLYAAEVEPRMGILYPEMREPYRTIFLDIIKGAEQEFDGAVLRYPLSKKHNVDTLERQMARDGVDVILALGKRSYDAVKSTQHSGPVLLGAMSSINSERYGGIKMEPSAEVVLDKLKLLAPAVSDVHVVYQPNLHRDLLDEAIRSAEQKGIKVHGHQVDSLRDSANAYRSILDSYRGSSQSIWLLRGGKVLDKAMLSEVLQDAWHKKLVVFSSVPTHVKRGALFSFVPDNIRMGQSLGRLAKEAVVSRHATCPVRPLEDVRLMVNRRTSDHLGLKISKELEGQIEQL